MKDMEKHIQSKLYNYEASYPIDLWSKIEAGLQPQKKRKRIFWFWFIPFFVVLGIGIFILLGNLDHTIDHIDLSERSNIPQISSTFPEPDQDSIEKEIFLNNNLKDNPEKIFTGNEFSNSKANFNRAKYSKVDKPEVLPSSLKTISPDKHKIKSQSNPPHSLESLENKEIHIMALDKKKLFIEENNDNEFPGPDCPVFEKLNNSKLVAEIYYSSDFPVKSYSPKNSESNNYKTERENSESPLYSFSAGLRFAYITSRNYGIKTGINYSQINEQFKYFDPDAYQSQTIITIDTIFSGGVATVVIDTSFLSIPGSLEVQHKNKFKFIDIPLIGTYEFDAGDRFYYSLDLGVLMNFSFSQQGRFINESGELAYFSSNNTEGEIIYQRGAGMSLYGGMSILYRWTNKLDLFISPSLKYFNKSLTTPNHALNQNYTIPGLNIGVRYKIK